MTASVAQIKAGFARAGSQRWLQIAIDRKPELLRAALRHSHALPSRSRVDWRSPIRADGFREHRDEAALALAEMEPLGHRRLSDFWPARGPVWDAIGVTGAGAPIFVEAKAHIPEAASSASRASAASAALISRSLTEARRWYAPRASARWDGLFYQYANRLAHHFLLRKVNHIPSTLVFLYFTNADDMQGPTTEHEWRGASRLIHAVLGLPASLESFGVYDAFVDAHFLQDAV